MHIWSSKTDEHRFGVHRRGSIYLNNLDDPKQKTRMLHWELSIPGRHWGIGIEFSYGDEPVNLNIGAFGFCFWLSLDTPMLRRLRDRVCPKKKDGTPTWEEREWKVTFHHGSAYWTIGRDPNSWSKADGWRNSSFNLPDFLLGRQKYTNEVLQPYVEVVIPMPEKNYIGKCQIERCTWKRKRWPFEKSIIRAEINLEKPPMFAGKGENSWDCDDDCIYAMTCGAKTVTEAITRYQEAVYRDRARYGMPSKVGA